MNKSNKKYSNFESQHEDDVFWRNSCKSLPTINEDNESLLFDDHSSSDSSYKEVQDSVKLPEAEKDYTGNQVLSDSDTAENFENEFQKNVEQRFPDIKNDFDDNDSMPGTSNSNFGSLDGLSSCDESVNIDPEDVENLKDDDNESMNSIDKFISSLPIDDEIFFSHLPSINRDPTAAVPLQNIEKDFEDKLVYISEIFDPAHFWFQFVIGDERYENFDKLHTRLNDDYDKLKKRELMIADNNFQEGLIVAAYVDEFKKWFRARITHNYNGEKKFIRLFFIDYGTNGTCPKSNIRYLFSYFMKYPKYCFRGRLYGIVPIDNKRSFDISHIEHFLKKISNYTTYATAVKYEEEEDVYQLKIIRRKGCIDMSEYVIENKLGQGMFPWDNDGEFSIGPPCYLIPTFSNLEYNHPTFAQIETMKKNDIDFNVMIDNNHLHILRRKDIENNIDLATIVNYPQFSALRKYFFRHN
ncbi:hypothetical protein ACKWTF_005979 [Chironomus riparius]